MQKLDSKLDLVMEKITDVAPEKIWKALTQPELLKQWFCPRPWKVVHAEIDLRPGGLFLTDMRGPNDENPGGPNIGCYLEVIPNRKLSWTSGLGPDFRPVASSKGEHDFPITAVITLEPHGAGTKYTAIAMHRDEASRKVHEQMGFEQGWGIAFDQMIELLKST